MFLLSSVEYNIIYIALVATSFVRYDHSQANAILTYLLTYPME
jgi:hypothetical protein